MDCSLNLKRFLIVTRKFVFFSITLVSFLATADSDGISHDLRFMGAELIDEMVYQWIKDPPVPINSGLVVADLSAPIGIDIRFNDLVENRLYELLRKNQNLKIALLHCSACQQWVTTTNSERTLIHRGIDQPETLSSLLDGTPEAMGLSLHFEARDRDLILLAQIFYLAPPQKVLWSQRFSTSLGLRQTLREASPLMSLGEARDLQNRMLLGREPLRLMTRIHFHAFQSLSALGTIPPLLFAEQGIEAEILPNRRQRLGLQVGITSLRDSLSGWSIGGRYSKLLFRPTPSFTAPDLYWFTGIQYMRLQGIGAALFAEDQIDLAKLLNENTDPKASHTVYQLGFEALIKHHFGMTVYLEYFPALSGSRVIAEKSFLLPYHGVGTGMVFQW